jgi:hypothetical protein
MIIQAHWGSLWPCSSTESNSKYKISFRLDNITLLSPTWLIDISSAMRPFNLIATIQSNPLFSQSINHVWMTLHACKTSKWRYPVVS